MISPGEIRISLGKSITLQQAKASGLQVRFVSLFEKINLKKFLYNKNVIIIFLGMHRKNAKFN